MTHDSRTESSGISRRIFLGLGAATGALALVMLHAPRAEAAAAPPAPEPDGAPPKRPHHTLLGLL